MNLVALKEVQFMTNITIQYLSSFINKSQILSLNAKRMINLGYMNKKDKLNKRFSDVSNASNMDDMLIPEEFPEGSYGAEKNQHTKVESKSTEWKDGQQRTSAYVYADRDQHDDLPRRTPGAHPLHDE